ncbi:hypothetical protein ElyMa_001418600 [Elysia marginata]|uniref:Uncharacterized protein n=1 Tax=Elysia marginata TaxID=1093978 RepID=A0AAV4J0C1_9GAST|nr:hypothetical protein ElyMa_001418600 [Elysia marginata]
MGFMGNPPVNLSLLSKTIADGDEPTVLASSQGASTVLFNPLFINGLIFECRLIGLAMQCVKPDDPVAQNAMGNQTNSISSGNFIENIDTYFVMYGLQTFVVLIVIMWILSTCIQHIHLIIWRRSVEAKLQLKMVEEMPRTWALQRV